MTSVVRAAAAVLVLTSLGACAHPSRDALTISVPYEIATLDPHSKNTASNFTLSFHMYDALVVTDGEMRIRPALAERWENPDASTWVFHLRRDVQFHSGHPLRASDVVYSIRRLLQDPRLEVAGYVVYLDQVEAVDPYTVRVRTRGPVSVLLNKLRFVAIVPDGATAETLADHADGTGPFRLVGWTSGKELRLARNDAYWGERPAFRDVTLRLGRSPDAAADDVVAHGVRLAQCNSRAASGRLGAMAGIELKRRPGLMQKYLGYDLVRDPTPFVPLPHNPFRDRRVREALSLAVDRSALVGQLSTEAVPATQLVPPTIFGFNPALPSLGFDPDVARRLLAEAGYPHGFPATLHVRRILAEGAPVLKEQLRRVGIDAEVVVLGDDEFLDRARRHEFSFYLSRIGAGTGDASDILDTGVHSPDPQRHMGLSNMGGYSNPAVDRAIEKSASIDDVGSRREALEAITALVMKDMAWVPLYVDQDTYAVGRELSWEPRNDGFVFAAEIRPAH